MPEAKSFGDDAFGERKAFGLDKGTGVLGDAVKLILERGVE